MSPSENQSGKDSQYDGDTDLRILHEGSDMMVTGLIKGVRDMERAQKLIKQESMNQNRDWIVRKLTQKIKRLGEQE